MSAEDEALFVSDSSGNKCVPLAIHMAEVDRQDKQFWEIERLTAEVEKLTKERDDFRDALRRLGCVC